MYIYYVLREIEGEPFFPPRLDLQCNVEVRLTPLPKPNNQKPSLIANIYADLPSYSSSTSSPSAQRISFLRCSLEQ